MSKAAKATQDVISARQLAERAKETYDTIDHWAGQGLLVFKRRGRTRLFSAKDNVGRCKQIRELQDAGHSLTTIRGMLNSL
jgi:DNA-binding transcriptional MerR regulator